MADKKQRIKKALWALHFEKVGSVTGEIDGTICHIGLHGNGKYWIDFGNDVNLTKISEKDAISWMEQFDYIDIDC